MEYIALKDVCEIKMGQSPDSSSYNDSEEGIPFFQGNADFGERYPVPRVWCNAPTKIAESGDILISVRAPIGALNYAKEECCIGRGVAALTPNGSKVLSGFVFWLLKSKKEELNSKGTGSTFKAIGRKVLEETMIPNIDKNEQHKCVYVLDKTYSVIQRRKREIQLFDELIKARFVEMFGSINNNIYKYEIKTLQDVCEKIKDGTNQTPIYTEDIENGFKFLSSKDVTTGKIDWSNIKYITAELHEKLYEKIKPRKGDILLAKNGTTGVAAVVEKEEVFDIYVSLALLRPIDINSVYLWAAINSDETKNQFNRSLKGIGVPNLHLGEIKNTKIIVPPIALQNQFADFVHQIDKSKLFAKIYLKNIAILLTICSIMNENTNGKMGRRLYDN